MKVISPGSRELLDIVDQEVAEPRLSGLQLQEQIDGWGTWSCGLEPERCGHHGKEMTGRKGTTEPTELVTDRMWKR